MPYKTPMSEENVNFEENGQFEENWEFEDEMSLGPNEMHSCM